MGYNLLRHFKPLFTKCVVSVRQWSPFANNKTTTKQKKTKTKNNKNANVKVSSDQHLFQRILQQLDFHAAMLIS